MQECMKQYQLELFRLQTCATETAMAMSELTDAEKLNCVELIQNITSKLKEARVLANCLRLSVYMEDSDEEVH